MAGTRSPSFPGSTSLFHHRSLGEVILTRSDSGTFNLLSIDLVERPSFDSSGDPIDFGAFDITFSGIKSDGSTVTNTFTLANFLTMETFTFTGFDDLVSVNWFQGGGGAPGDQTHQFDNIVVVFDSDGDGISDADDACPDSDTRPTVVIGDCDSGVENTLFADGCTLSDLISQIAAASSSEAEFVRGVHELLRDLGLPAKDRQKILKCARQ